MTYASEINMEAILGMDIALATAATSRPTTEQLAEMLTQADSIINAEAKQATNSTDTSGRLKVIAVSLTLKYINNMFSLSNPGAYSFVEVELSDDQKRIIHMELGVWDALSWEVGI